MKWLAAALLVVVVGLQYRLWLSGDGVRELARLSNAVEQQKAENEELVARNRQMIAEVVCSGWYCQPVSSPTSIPSRSAPSNAATVALSSRSGHAGYPHE